MAAGAGARKVRVQLAEASFFPALGVRATRGRFYTAAEDEPGARLTAVIGEDFWERELGRDPQVLGRVLALNKGQYEIVGVVPSGFTGVDVSAGDIWLPLRAAMVVESTRRALETRTWWWAQAFVRLRLGVTDQGSGLITLSVLLLSATGHYALMAFMVTQRRAEIGLRMALGANPFRLLTMIMSRSFAQLAIGITIGSAIAWMMLAEGEITGENGMAMLPCVAAIVLLVGLLAAATPARRALRVQPIEALRDE